MTQAIILTIIATIVAYRVLIQMARTGRPGGRRDSLGRLLGLPRRIPDASEGTATALRRSGGAGEE